MKMREKEINIERSGDIIESTFGISSKDSVHILSILRDKLYSNKILAVVREYCTNAQDAHAEIGSTEPIEVSIPNGLNPHFIVRDYGSGLSEEDVRNIYVMYGASTKRQSNTVVGQLGLGCKSAFAYADQFSITSWYDGEKKTYTAYIDETGVGKIALLSSEPSTEREGIEVKVPVRIGDFHKFSTETSMLLEFFEPTPIINGINIEKHNYEMEEDIEPGVKFKIIHKPEYGASRVIMGGIPYQFEHRYLTTEQQQFCSLGIHLFVNIGDVDVAAHRESLEFTDHTKTTLCQYLDKAMLIALKTKTDLICNTPTYREANLEYTNTNFYNLFWRQLNLVMARKWNGYPIDGLAVTSKTNIASVYCCFPQGNGYKWYDTNTVKAKEDLNIYLVGNIKQWKHKLGGWFNYKNINSNNICVIKFDDTATAKDIDEFIKYRRLNEYNLINISDCEVPKHALKTLKSTIAKQPRSTTHIGNIFILKDVRDRLRLKTAKSKDWKRIKEIPDGIKYYVTLDKFRILLDEYTTLYIRDFETILDVAEHAGFIPDKIYGVKKAQVAKLDSTWIPLIDKIKEEITNSELVQKVVDINNFLENITPQLRIFIKKNVEFPEESTAKKLMDITQNLSNIHKKATYSINTFEQTLRTLSLENVITNCKPTHKFEEAIREAKSIYTLTAQLDIFPGRPYTSIYNRSESMDNIIKSTVEYVKLIEGKKNGISIHYDQ